jgi:hypothetical protein
MRSRRSRWIAVVSATIAMGGGALWLWRRPAVSDTELREIESFAGDALRAQRTQSCRRQVLRGRPIDGDTHAEFRALLDPRGPFGACWALRDAHDRALAKALRLNELSSREIDLELPALPPGDALADDALVPEEWWSFATGRPIRAARTELESELLNRCAPVVVAVRRLVRHGSVCTPNDLVLEQAPGMPIVHLSQIVSIAARDRLRQGAVLDGIQLILDGIRISADFVRGRVTALVAMLANAAIATYLGQLEILLAMDLPWDEATLRSLQSEIEILVRTVPTPDGFFRDDAIAMLIEQLLAMGWRPPFALPPVERTELEREPGVDPNEMRRITAAAFYALARDLERVRCRADDTRQACLAAIERSPRAAMYSPSAGSYLARHGWLLRRARQHMRRDVATNLASYAHRMLVTDAALRAQWVVLEHRRLALAEGRCPSAAQLRARLASVPTETGLGGRFAIRSSALPDRPIEIGAPMWLRPRSDLRPNVWLPLARAYCPAFSVVTGPPPSSE